MFGQHKIVGSFLFIFLCHFHGLQALVMKLLPYKTECLQFSGYANGNLTLSFSMFPENSKQVRAWIYNQTSGEIIYNLHEGTLGKYNIQSFAVDKEKDAYEFCTQNGNSFILTVEFFLRTPLSVSEVLATEEKTRGVIKRIQEVDATIGELSDQLSYMLTNESLHRETAKQTNHRVIWWIVFKVEINSLCFRASPPLLMVLLMRITKAVDWLYTGLWTEIETVSYAQDMASLSELNPDEDAACMEHQNNEWTVYPSACYSAAVCYVQDSEDTSTEPESTLMLPPGPHIRLEEYVNTRLQSFIDEGMQHTVAAIILAHERCSPRVLLLDVDTDENIFQQSSMLPNLSYEPDVPLLQTLSLPMFSYKRWEHPVTVLEQQLARFVRCKATKDSPMVRPTTMASFHDKNRIKEPKKAPETKCSPENNPVIDEGNDPDASEAILTDSEKTCRASQDACFAVKSFLGVWCLPEFGTPPLPFIPSHVTRPKEQIRLYQVILSPDCEFLHDANLPFKLRFASMNFLLQAGLLTPSKCLGAAYAGISSLLCRFSLAFMTPQRLDEAEFKKERD